VWRRGSAQDLGPLDDDCFSEAFAINSSDQIVGQSFSCVSNTLRTFLWENGSIADLNVLASSDALQLVEAFAINDRGEIGGIGDPPGCSADDQCGHAFVLIPCDEAHPNTKGCDYSLVAAAVEPQRPAPRYLPNVAQRPPQSRRTNRYHIPGLFPPSR